MKPQTISTLEAARRLDCTRQYVHYLLKNGRIRGTFIGRLWNVETASLRQIERMKPGPKPKNRSRHRRNGRHE